MKHPQAAQTTYENTGNETGNDGTRRWLWRFVRLFFLFVLEMRKRLRMVRDVATATHNEKRNRKRSPHDPNAQRRDLHARRQILPSHEGAPNRRLSGNFPHGCSSRKRVAPVDSKREQHRATGRDGQAQRLPSHCRLSHAYS